jgi:glutaredoxin-related protein
MKPLKEFLVLRDTLDLYSSVRGKGTVGIPMLAVTENGQTHYYRGLPEDLSLLK